MKILLSAYACEPNRGSEPGVGWNWAHEIAARDHHVVVLTRTNNRSKIEAAGYDKTRITFVYYDLPYFIVKFKRFLGVNLYYMLWQFALMFSIKKWHSQHQFDCVHHITFGVFRNISFIPFVIRKPFVFGPVGGGELAPKHLINDFNFKTRFKEASRNLINRVVYVSPLYRAFLVKPFLIITKTVETSFFIPARHKSKLMVSLEIGIHEGNVFPVDAVKLRDRKTLLFVGRFIYWKGIQLLLETFLKLHQWDSSYRLIIIGKGSEQKTIRQFIMKNNLSNIQVIDELAQPELKAYYLNSSLLVFPSLHDSSGNVVLEALSFGLPVVSLDVGGPREVIGQGIDTIVPNNNKTTKELAVDIAAKIEALLNNKEVYEGICEKSFMRSQELTWQKSVERVYTKIESEIN